MELCDEGGATLAAFEAGEGPLVFEVVQPEGLSSLLCIPIPDGPVANTGAYLRLHVTAPAIRLETLVPDIIVSPPHFDSPEVDIVEMPVSTSIMLRPEDRVYKGNDVLFDVRTSWERQSRREEEVQVNSSLPDEANDPGLSVRATNTKQREKGSAVHLPGARLQTPSQLPRGPTIEETPANIGRTIDVFQQPGPTRLQQSALLSSSPPRIKYEESQELVGFYDHRTMSGPNQSGARVDRPTEPESLDRPAATSLTSASSGPPVQILTVPAQQVGEHPAPHLPAGPGEDEQTESEPDQETRGLPLGGQSPHDLTDFLGIPAPSANEDVEHLLDPPMAQTSAHLPDLSPREHVQPVHEDIVPPVDEGIISPLDELIVPSIDECVIPPVEENIVPSIDEDIDSQVEEDCQVQVSSEASSQRPSKKRKTAPPSLAAEEQMPNKRAKARSSVDTAKLTEPSPPSSSTRARRRTSSDKSAQDQRPKISGVAFSNSTVTKSPSLQRFLTRKGLRKVERVTFQNYEVLVVGKGQLKTTAKLLKSLVLRKHIATDAWLLQSAKEDAILDPTRFGHKEVDMEADRSKLFEDTTIVSTPALRKEYGTGWKDMEELAKLAGARSLLSKPLRSVNADDEHLLILGLEREDLDAISFIEYGKPVYTKELFTSSILHGHLQFDEDQYKVRLRPSQTNGGIKANSKSKPRAKAKGKSR